jgi:hypothetical protein
VREWGNLLSSFEIQLLCRIHYKHALLTGPGDDVGVLARAAR